MKKNQYIRPILLCALLFASLISVAAKLLPGRHLPSRLSRLPLHGLGFVGRDIPLNASEETVFKRAAVLKRLYQVGENRIVLLAVDSGGDRHAVHDPRYCFRGAGWTVVEETPISIPGGESRLVRLTKDGSEAEALYWITDGERRYVSLLRVWWQAVLNRAGLAREGLSPTLVLLQPIPGESVNWTSLLERFPDLVAL